NLSSFCTVDRLDHMNNNYVKSYLDIKSEVNKKYFKEILLKALNYYKLKLSTTHIARLFKDWNSWGFYFGNHTDDFLYVAFDDPKFVYDNKYKYPDKIYEKFSKSDLIVPRGAVANNIHCPPE